MTINDPIADMLTRIRNAIAAEQPMVALPSSKLKASIAEILVQEGYIAGQDVVQVEGSPQPVLRLRMKYVGQRRLRRPVITGLERVSRPGRRIYVGKDEIPWVLSGMGIAILTTPRGVMTGLQARKQGIGGELLCKVW
ncbi:MAG TPA: 30S ribosomal protein S8 [Anaerolineales bacterium]|jgi:small subunit ribosomal protein S8